MTGSIGDALQAKYDKITPVQWRRMEKAVHRYLTYARRHAPTQTETQLVRAIMDYLRARGIWVERRNSRVLTLPGKGGRMRPVRFGGMKGASDLIAIGLQGKFWAIEVKRPGQTPTPEQAWYLTEVSRHGGVAMVATSVQDVAEALERQVFPKEGR